MKLGIEMRASDADEFLRLCAEHPDDCIKAHSRHDARMVTFVFNMTHAIAPEVFAYLSVLAMKSKKVTIISDGVRQSLTESEIKTLKDAWERKVTDVS